MYPSPRPPSARARRLRRAGRGILLAAALVACARAPETPDAPAAPPHVLLVTVDTLRADHLGCYGYRLDTSATIDRLAAEGVQFMDCTVQWPKTWPSMASLMTGMYPRTTGIQTSHRRLADALPVLSESFRDAGYATAAVVGNFNVGRTLGFDQGFDHFVESWMARWRELHGDAPFRNEAGKVKEYTSARIIVDQALAWLDGKDPERPFFLWLHFMDPHGPYDPPASYADLFADAHPPQEVPLEVLPAYQIQQAADGSGPITDLAHYKAQYDREIRSLDDELGRLFAALESQGLRDQTLTAFTADHGESLDEHEYYLEHGRFSYQVNAHVPLILRWPGVLDAGHRVEEPVGLIDLTPTLLDLAGLPQGPLHEGRSLAGLARGEAGAAPPPHVFMESGYHEDRTQLTVRRGRWKLIQVRAKEDRERMQGSPFELYDVWADPGETRNLAREQPEVVRRLKPVLTEWYQGGISVDGGTDLDLSNLDPEAIEMLRALGYIR